MTTSEDDPVWAAVVAAVVEYGEGAEDHARRELAKAIAAGDTRHAVIWEAAAQSLHTFHTINRTWVRSRGDLLPRVIPTNAGPRESSE